jgi:hypothetical protein
MRRAAVLLLVVLVAAGCGGGPKRIAADHATLTRVTVLPAAVAFDFDVQPDKVTSAYAARASLAECGSGAPVRPNGEAFAVVHFTPAQTQGVPKRIVMPSGTVLDVWKVCDFEADVAWAVGLAHRVPIHVFRDGSTVTVTFGG